MQPFYTIAPTSDSVLKVARPPEVGVPMSKVKGEESILS